jgi:bifunctional UDP-N-acetylglucosamine pyrophosphorylase / glucosamine-1-phosphate N-acetyltransferase
MIDVIILAAGKGTRMKTERPKALVEAKGKTMLHHVLDAVDRSGILSGAESRPASDARRPHVIVGHKGEDIIALFGNRIKAVWQKEQKGTGHAVAVAQDALRAPERVPAEHIVVLFADQPLISAESLRKLVWARAETFDSAAPAAFSMATVSPEHHDGDFKVFERNGRIVRDEKTGAVREIVEYKDASDEIRALKEVNISAYCFDPAWLWKNLSEIRNANASGEYYLTDLVKIARDKGEIVIPVVFPTIEGMGANSPEELSILERYI